MVMREDSHERPVRGRVRQRIDIPDPHRGLRADIVALRPTAEFRDRLRFQLQTRRAGGAAQQTAVGALVDAQTAFGLDGSDAVAHFLRAERAVLIVEPVRRAVRGHDVELHKMDVLADDVRWGAHLEIVKFHIRRH